MYQVSPSTWVLAPAEHGQMPTIISAGKRNLHPNPLVKQLGHVIQGCMNYRIKSQRPYLSLEVGGLTTYAFDPVPNTYPRYHRYSVYPLETQDSAQLQLRVQYPAAPAHKRDSTSCG